MQLSIYRHILAVVLFCLSSVSMLWGQARPEDCLGAIIICSDEVINFNPDGIGIDDFANPNNDNGCLETKEKEGLWFFFAFRTDMPPDSEIEFTLTPVGQDNEDYDFAIYGPDLTCDSLGSPLRCTFFDQICYGGTFNTPYRCPETGLGRGATDTSETKFYEDAEDDGFVAPIVVQPGEGFYMYLDNFGTTARAFQLEWGGSAAPYLNCLTDPVCNSKKVDAGPDEQLCFDETFLPIQTTLTNTTPEAVIRWSAEPAIALTFLSDTTAREPVANIPLSFSGEIIYTMTMIDEGCERIDRKRVLVNRPDVTITGQTPFCTGAVNTLSAPEGFERYLWNTGDTTFSIEVSSPGLYSLEVEDSLGCVARGELQVDAFAPLLFEAEGPDTVCLNEVANLRSSPGFETYLWSNAETTQNIFISGAGMYYVTATDSNGCIYTDSLMLNEYDPPAPAFSGDPSFCDGLTGTIIASPGYAAYAWSTGETTESITVSEGGVYTVTVTDNRACEGTGSYEILKTTLPRPIIDGTLNICAGTSTDLSVDPSFRSILWSTTETAPTINVSSGGLVGVAVEDALGCRGTDTVEVTENALPELLVQGESGFCPGGSVVLDAGEGFVSYLWSTGETTRTIIADQVQNYGLTVTDANGCQADGMLQVIVYSNPEFELEGDLSVCQGDSTEITVISQAPIAAYNWSNGRNGQSTYFTTEDIYNVEVIGENGCTSNLDFLISVDTLPVVNIAGDVSICPGSIATLTAPPGYEDYLWSTGAKTETLNIDTAGLYSLRVRDANLCVGEGSVTITENAVPNPRFSGKLGICPGDTTQVRVIGGYQGYRWPNGDTTPETRLSQPGTYVVTVTDNLGCEGTAPIEITTFTPPSPVIAGKEAFCEGYTSVLQVNGNYSAFEWSTGDDRYLTVINQAGAYRVTVTDQNGCQGEATKSVRVNPRPVLNLSGEPEFCQGGQTVIDAGPGFIDYIWSTGNRTPTNTITMPGYYSVVVRDTNNCLIAQGMIIEENPVPDPVVIGDSVICEVGGSTTLSVTQTYNTYSWSNGVTTRTNAITQSGNYTVTVTDGNECQGEISFEVRSQANPDPVLIGNLGFCEGADTEVRVAPTYETYEWSTGDVGDRIRIDRPDTYSVTVTDALGCVGAETFQVEEYFLPVIDLEAAIDVCPDVVVSIDGGPGFSAYLWSNGDTSRYLQTDRTGTYRLTVTDANGCSDSTSTTLTALDKPIVTLPEDMVVCPESSVRVEAAAGFIRYNWSDGTTGRVLIASNPDTYTLTVEDDNGCEASDSIRIMDFPTEVPVVLGPDTICVNENSLLSVQQDFDRYRWAYILGEGMVLGNDTSQVLRIQGGGQFTVTVTDRNGCETMNSFEVTEIALPEFEFVGDRSLCEGLNARVGVSQPFASYRWSNGATDSVAVFFTPMIYSVTVQDEYGCEASKSISIEERESPLADAGPDVEFPCTDSTIQIGGTQNAQGPHIRYNWVGPGIDVSNYNIPNPVISEPGDYFFLVRDTLTGCQSKIQQVKVFSGAGEYAVDLVVGDNIDCENQLVELDASRSEKADSLTFQWLDAGKQTIEGATGPVATVNGAGWYFLETLLFDTRCARTDSIFVQPDQLAPRAVAGRDQSLTCDQPAITLDAGASSQGVGLAYEWRLADALGTLVGQDQRVAIANPGAYVLFVINQNNGCTGRDTVLISLNQQAPRASLPESVVIDCLQPTVILDGGASQTGENIAYRWRDGTSGDLMAERSNQLLVSQGGRYQLIVENQLNGCTDTAATDVIDRINELEILDLDFGAPACSDEKNGFIAINEVAGGMTPYSYSFDGGQTFSALNRAASLPGGVYNLVVEDVTGCRTERRVELANGNSVEISLGPDQVIELGEQVEVEASIRAGKPIATFEWLEPDTFRQETSRTLIDMPQEDRTFVARVTDEDGCTAVDTAFVKVLINREVYIPNVFHPESTQVNNRRFTVFASSQVKEIKRLAIFDRWGDQIFVLENFPPNDPSLGWDGNYRGEPLNLAVFAYFCEIEFLDGEKAFLEGDVLLIR